MPAQQFSARTGACVSARIALLIGQVLQARGLSTPGVFAQVGLRPSDLLDADARIPLEVEEALWRAAAEASGDPLFGLHAAQAVRPGGFDVLDYVVRTASTLRESLQRLRRYNRLLHDVAGFELLDEGETLKVQHGLSDPAHPASPQAAEFTLASLVVVGRQLLPPLRAIAVTFVHPPLGSLSDYEQVFGVEPVFDAAVNAVCFEAAQMHTTLSQADPVLSRIVTTHADQVLAALPPVQQSVTAAVRSLIAQALPEGAPSLEVLAQRLHMSPRNLQRRLRAEDVRYADLLDKVRKELALRHIADPRLALGEVAYLAGFAEPSPFHRAFRRWTGTTPTAYRRACRR